MSRGLRLAGGIVVSLAACGALAAWAGEAAPSADEIFKQVAAYKYGESRKPLIAAEDLVKASYNKPEERKAVVARLVGVVAAADATADARRFACRQLSIVGGPEVVPAVAKFLPDADLSHMARMVLERVPGDEAGTVLRDGLGTLKGKLLIGTINSLGQRRDAKAAAALTKLLADADVEVAKAAATALGKIGGAEATAALADARAKASPPLRPAVVDAYLRCADHLVAEGKAPEGCAIYEQMTGEKEPQLVRIAALRGLVAAGSEKALPLVTAALTGKDPVMQVVATSFIREMKGDAAQAFGDLLPKLEPKAQALVLAALAERGDPSARPIVLAAVQREADVRVAALDALAQVGTADDVPMLAKIAATGQNNERGPAANALNRLGSKGVDDAILKAMEGADAPVRAALIRSLAARRCAAAVPTLLKAAADADPTVRAESINALGVLGDEKALPALVALLVNSKPGAEQSAAERAIQAVGGRIKDADARVQPLLAGLAGASVDARRALLQLLGRFGGPKALEAVRAALKDQDAQIQDAAIRALSSWPDASVLGDLIGLAKAAPQPNQKIIALRGYVGLLGLPNQRPAAESLKLYQDAMGASTRPDEKKLVLGGLGQVHHIGALKIAEECLADKALINEAAAAIVSIAKAIGKAHKTEAVGALTKVTQEEVPKNIRKDAANLLNELKK